MRSRILLTVLSAALILALAACGGQGGQGGQAEDDMMEMTPTGEMMEEEMMDETPAEEMMEDEMMEVTPTGEMMEDDMMEATQMPGEMEGEGDTGSMDGESSQAGDVPSPAWFAVPLTDVSTGSSFSVSELKGKVVLVETMAIWCSTCRSQQNEIKRMHELMGEQENFVSLALDIDPNEQAEDLKTYAETLGFDWVYAISPAEVSRDLANLYGNQFLNPPSVPKLLIDASGNVTTLPFGVMSAEDLLETIEPLLDEAM